MNILQFALAAFCYLLLYIVYPYLCFGYLIRTRFCDKNERKPFLVFFICLIIGNISVIFIVYALFLLGIYNNVSFLISLVLFAACCQLLGGRARIEQIRNAAVKNATLISARQFRLKTKLINFRSNINPIKFTKPAGGYVFNALVAVATFACIAYGFYMKTYPSLFTSYFGVSDMYVHLSWIRAMQEGTLYITGVYPYGFHNLLIATSEIFPFDLAILLQLWGPISFLLILASLVFLTRRLFKSPVALLVVVWVFCVSDIFVFFRYEDIRIYNALPQEYAMIFAFPAIVFLLDYFTKGRRRYLLLSALCFSLTLLIHFFITIFIGFAYIVIVFINFRHLFKLKTFLNLAVVFGLATVIALLPLVVGVLQGNPLEPALYWAIGSFSGPKEDKADEDAPSEPAPPTNLLGDIRWLLREEFRAELFPDDYTISANVKGFNYRAQMSLLLPNGENKFLFPYILGLAAAFVLIVLKIYKRQSCTPQLWLLLFCAMLFVLAIAYQLGFPQILVLDRQRALLRLTMFPIIGFVPELIAEIAGMFKGKKVKVLPYSFLTAIIILIAVDSLYFGDLCDITQSIQAQYGQIVDVILKIKKEFPPHTYTMLSTTHELSIIRDKGFHYELTTFTKALEDRKANLHQYIPTEDIFIYVEKLVLPVYRYVDFSYPDYPYKTSTASAVGTPPEGAYITHEDAFQELPMPSKNEPRGPTDFYYVDPRNRRVLMAKLYYWANAYMKYYPDEMSIYYEDDKIVVYHLKQDAYALNNLNMDYLSE